ncbi:MAG TPA: type VI secretion system contractile sheath small subunit [Thermoanaerobaculia bacterium]
MPESTQKKLSRVRPPRVQITYDVEIGDAIQMKELPFVVGIMADLSGKPAEALPKLKERKFVEIDRDNFNDVLASCAPRLALRVDNKLAKDDTKLNVELSFRNIDDFSPVEVVKQVEPLRKLFEARQRLMDLLSKLDGNDKLDALLQEIVDNPETQKALKASTTAAPAA